MVEGATSAGKKQLASVNNKSFNEQNQSKIVLRRLPPTLTSEQFLENVSPLPDHDYYRFCKADLSLGQQHSFSRAYLNIPNQQDLIVFTEKFQGYVFLDKNGNEYICSVEYAPNQSKPKSDNQSRRDPKMNSIEQDPEYQTFVANMNAPATGADALPNAETMLEEIEKKQRELHESKHKSGSTTTPLLEFLKRKREDRKQEKIIRIQQRRSHKQQTRNHPTNDDARPSTARNVTEEEYNASPRYGGERSNRHQQRGYDKGDYRSTQHDPKRATNQPKSHNAKAGKQQQQQQQPAKVQKSVSQLQVTTDEGEPPAKLDETAKSSAANAIKARPSMQIYNPGERARMRRQQNPN